MCIQNSLGMRLLTFWFITLLLLFLVIRCRVYRVKWIVSKVMYVLLFVVLWFDAAKTRLSCCLKGL